MDNIEIIISIKDTHLGSMPDIVKKLQDLGETNVQSLSSVGIITASIPKNLMKSASEIEGIESVEPSQIIEISPPDSPVQ